MRDLVRKRHPVIYLLFAVNGLLAIFLPVTLISFFIWRELRKINRQISAIYAVYILCGIAADILLGLGTLSRSST